MKKIIIALIACTLFTVSACEELALDPEGLQVCSNDAECIIVKKDCCGCSNGGEDFSINKTYEEYWNSHLAARCSDIYCITVYTCPAVMTPACVNGTCVIITE